MLYQKLLKVSNESIKMYEEIIDRNFKIYSDFRKKETDEKIKQLNEAKILLIYQAILPTKNQQLFLIT